jgi:hypothetical protein
MPMRFAQFPCQRGTDRDRLPTQFSCAEPKEHFIFFEGRFCRPNPRKAAGILRFSWVTRIVGLVTCVTLAAPLAAKDSLGVFGQWGAFRDPAVPRCYAISEAESERAQQPGYVSVGTWPRRQVRGQLHVRLSRQLVPRASIRLAVGGERFQLTGGGADAWAQDRRMDAAIVAAMRSARSMSVSATDRAGRRFTDRYSLEGAATAMDAATVGCARAR